MIHGNTIKDLYTFLFIQFRNFHIIYNLNKKNTQIKYTLLKQNVLFWIIQWFNYCYRMINCFEMCNGVLWWLNYMQAYEETHKLTWIEKKRHWFTAQQTPPQPPTTCDCCFETINKLFDHMSTHKLEIYFFYFWSSLCA